MPALPPQTPPKTVNKVPARAGISLTINGKTFLHTGDPRLPLLWYLRDHLRLTGAKYGCDSGTCGACSVLLDGRLVLACERSMDTLAGQQVTTVEGLAGPDGQLHALQQAWIDEDAILCGYCQPGWLMAAADLLKRRPVPTDADIDALTNLCRCGSQPRIRRAIHLAATRLKKAGTAP